MKVEALHVGMNVKHPQYGLGVVTAVNRHTTDIDFAETGKRTLAPEMGGIEPADAQIAVTGLEAPLALFVQEIIHSTVKELGLEKPDSVVQELGARWHGGKMVLHPADPTLQVKDVPLEAFFHKIVMMRNNFRTLEQKINSHTKLTDGEKVELQQYISRCYGSMTTFNILFKDKDDQFNSGL